jgi:hypothetical protein
VVAHAVKAAIAQGKDLSELPLATLQGFNAASDDVFDVLSLRGSLNARNVLGGTAPAQVRRADRAAPCAAGLMALPLVLVLGFVGAAIGWLASALSKGNSTRMMSVVVFVPFAFGAVEQELPLQDQVQAVSHSIDIQAPPEVVWRHINMPTGIQPGELKDGVAYRIGVPYPIEGRTLEPRVGGKRHLVWQRGVAFDEEITVWEPQRRVAWKYVFGPGSFPEGSLDDHIVIGGRYFNLEPSCGPTPTSASSGTFSGTSATLAIRRGISARAHSSSASGTSNTSSSCTCITILVARCFAHRARPAPRSSRA